MTATTAPESYFSVCSTSDPLARTRRLARVAEYESWRVCMPDDVQADERDWTTVAAGLARSIGSSPRFIASNLEALDTLDKLPALRELIEELHHLDMFHLRKIDETLIGLSADLYDDPFFWETLDDILTEHLSPTRPNQLLPTPASITRKIRGVIRMLEKIEEPEDSADPADPDESADADAAEEPRASNSYRSHTNVDGSVTTEFRLDALTYASVEKAVRSYANEHGCSFAQALTALLLEKIQVQVVLDVYRAHDTDDAPGFLQPIGWLDRECTERAVEMATKVRDMDEAAEAEVAGYQSNPPIRAFLEGRDGTCRWPGCNRPAIYSQKDHRINHRDGGPTTAANMVCLCQHHHNRKSDGQVHYVLDAHTGDVIWLFADGEWVADEAEGPLAPKQRRWVQTLSQRRARRRERARAKAEARRREQGRKGPGRTPQPPPRTTREEQDDPPPF